MPHAACLCPWCDVILWLRSWRFDCGNICFVYIVEKSRDFGFFLKGFFEVKSFVFNFFWWLVFSDLFRLICFVFFRFMIFPQLVLAIRIFPPFIYFTLTLYFETFHSMWLLNVDFTSWVEATLLPTLSCCRWSWRNLIIMTLKKVSWKIHLELFS